jgi:hypothetical protein
VTGENWPVNEKPGGAICVMKKRDPFAIRKLAIAYFVQTRVFVSIRN